MFPTLFLMDANGMYAFANPGVSNEDNNRFLPVEAKNYTVL